MFPYRVMVLKLLKLSFLQIFSGVSEKSAAVIAVYVFASESSCFVLLENGIGYYAMAYSLEDISV